jgi:C4-dicarboxylate-specific signal transduction histidine kinase
VGLNRFPPWFLSATALVVAIATILAIVGLRRSADSSWRVSVDLIELQAVSTQLDGIEEASSYRKTVDPSDRQRVGELDRQAQAILKQLHLDAGNAREVDVIQSAYTDYINALQPTLDLLVQKDISAAEKLDDGRVDPAFERLTTLLSQENALALQATRRANQITDSGSIFTIVLATLTIGAIAQRIQQVNNNVQQALADQAVLQARETTLQAERALLEERVAERTCELDAKNKDLTQALDQLQIAQVELVQAEKMATLGQLVAGIAHEINTPLGAIQASTGNSSKALAELLECLVQAFGDLPQDLRQPFLGLLRCCLVPSPSLSSMERRP